MSYDISERPAVNAMKTYTSHFIERVRCCKLLGFLQVILRHVEVSLCSYILLCEMRHLAGFIVSLLSYECQPAIHGTYL